MTSDLNINDSFSIREGYIKIKEWVGRKLKWKTDGQVNITGIDHLVRLLTL